jgi:hypothetical protein
MSRRLIPLSCLTLSLVACSGAEPASQVQGGATQDDGTSTWAKRPDPQYALASSLAPVATSGSYTDLTERPDLSVYVESAHLASVALSGSYAELSNAPWAADGSSIYATNVDGAAGADQDTALAYNGYAGGWADCWQSFTAGRSGPLTAVRIWAFLPGGTTLTLHDGEGISGNVLATATSLVDKGSDRWEAALPGVGVIAGHKYTVRLVAPSNLNWVVGTYAYAGGVSSVYGAGADFGLTTYLGDGRVVVTSSGRLGVGVSTPTSPLDVAGDRIRVRTARTPASGSVCEQGEWSWDADHVYVCVAANTWRRATLAAY